MAETPNSLKVINMDLGNELCNIGKRLMEIGMELRDDGFEVNIDYARTGEDVSA